MLESSFRKTSACFNRFRAILVALLFLAPATSARIAAIFLNTRKQTPAPANSNITTAKNNGVPTKKTGPVFNAGLLVLINLISSPRFFTPFLSVDGIETVGIEVCSSLPFVTLIVIGFVLIVTYLPELTSK